MLFWSPFEISISVFRWGAGWVGGHGLTFPYIWQTYSLSVSRFQNLEISFFLNFWGFLVRLFRKRCVIFEIFLVCISGIYSNIWHISNSWSLVHPKMSYVSKIYIIVQGSRIVNKCITDTCIMDTCILDTHIMDTSHIDVEVGKEVLVTFAWVTRPERHRTKSSRSEGPQSRSWGQKGPQTST